MLCLSLLPNVLAADTHMTDTRNLKAFKEARREAARAAAAAKDPLAFARKFMRTTLVCLRKSEDDLKTSGHALAREIAKLVEKLDLEDTAYLLGTVYTAMLPPEFRARNGVFYTPPSASRRLIAIAETSGVRWESARVADISCGGGAFLAPAAIRMLRARKPSTARAAFAHLRTHLFGFELDPFSAWMSEVFLAAAFRELFPQSNQSFAGFVHVGDSLARDFAPFGKFDLVIGNPPYGKIALSPGERLKWHRSLYGHANLYALFTDLAVSLLAADGVLAYVTPASFLGGHYFKRLRALLAEEAPPAAIDFMASRAGVFTDVLQETVLIACRRGSPRRISISFTELAESGPAKVTGRAEGLLPDSPADPWFLPRSTEQVEILERVRSVSWTLRDFGYRVSTGPLVWNRHKSRLHSTKPRGGVPILWAESVAASGSGDFSWERPQDRPLWYAPSDNNDVNIVRTPCVLVQRTTATEQPRRIVAAALPPAFIRRFPAFAIENHLNMVHAATSHPALDVTVIASLLNSSIVDQIFRCISGSTAVSAYELEAVPLPAPSRCASLAKLVRSGADRASIDRCVASLYAPLRPSTAT